MDIDDLKLFMRIARLGSISAAARDLSLTPAGASARLAAFEKRLGARLLHRTTRQATLTVDGLAFLPHAEHVLDAADAARAALGREHAQIAGLLLDAGSVYTALGDDARAEALSREALAIWTRTLGEEHPDLALALANIGMIELGRGDLDAALATTERARAIVAASLGETHSNMALPLQNLGRIHFARGDLDTALGLHERALEIAKRTVGESDALALEAQLGIGLVQTAKGEVELAIATLERARTLAAARRLAPRRIAELDDALSRARSLRGGG